MSAAGIISRRLHFTAGCTLLLAACSAATPSASLPGSSSPTASAAASGQARSPGSDDVAAGEFLQVVADELRLRSAAGTDAMLVDTLPGGTLVRVESEAVEADGFRWREVLGIDGQSGWAADGDATDPWLTPVPEVDGGTPVVILGTVCDVIGPLNVPTTVVMDDGWVIAPDPSAGGAHVTRQLTSDGLEEVRGAVQGSAHLQASDEYLPQPKPGAEPPGHGACQYTFTIPTAGGDPIVVSSVGWFGDEEESTFYQPSPERRALDALARNLTNIMGLLDDGSWTGRATPYVAEELVLRIEEGIGGPAPEGAPELDPAVLGLGDIDEFGDPVGTARCGIVSRAQGFELARLLNRAEPGFSVRLDNVSTPYFTTDDRWFGLVFGPRLPGGQPECPAF